MFYTSSLVGVKLYIVERDNNRIFHSFISFQECNDAKTRSYVLFTTTKTKFLCLSMSKWYLLIQGQWTSCVFRDINAKNKVFFFRIGLFRSAVRIEARKFAIPLQSYLKYAMYRLLENINITQIILYPWIFIICILLLTSFFVKYVLLTKFY